MSGTLELDLRVERAGVPIVHHVERFGPAEPGAGSSVGVADARHVISGVVIGADPGEAVTRVGADGRGAWLPVAADAAMVLVVAPDRPAALRLLALLRPCLQGRASVPGTDARPSPDGATGGRSVVTTG